MTNQEAIATLQNCAWLGTDKKVGQVEEAIQMAVEALENIPPAQPEPERFKSCKNCIHLGHGYMMPCKNCRRNQVMPDWYEVET